MPGQPHRVELESVHWPTLLPSLRLFDSFKQAIHPAKLSLAFLLVLLLYLGGAGLDLLLGDQVYDDEVNSYFRLPAERFDRFLELMDAAPAATRRTGVFEAFLAAERMEFGRLVSRLLDLDLGIAGLAAGRADTGALGSLGRMFIGLPGWVMRVHPLFFWIYLPYAFALTCLLGGAISRLAALQACRDIRQTGGVGLRFAAGRLLWFILALLIPLGIAGLFALLLAVVGAALFNVPGLDILGGALFGLWLGMGMIVALVLIGLAVAMHVLFPAIAVENVDAFDAISRAYNYVVGRPARFLGYVLVSLLFFVLTYLLVSLVIQATIAVTDATVGAWTFTRVADDATRYDAIRDVAGARAGLSDGLGGTAGAAAWLADRWTGLLRMLPPAFAVSFYFCASTWIYLLLRRSADGVEFDDVYLKDAQPVTLTPQESEPSDV